MKKRKKAGGSSGLVESGKNGNVFFGECCRFDFLVFTCVNIQVVRGELMENIIRSRGFFPSDSQTFNDFKVPWGP